MLPILVQFAAHVLLMHPNHRETMTRLQASALKCCRYCTSECDSLGDYLITSTNPPVRRTLLFDCRDILQ